MDGHARSHDDREARLAANYDTFLGALTRPFTAATVRAASIAPGDVVIDLGAGTGHLGAAAHAAGARVLLVDRSAAMLDIARSCHPELRTMVSDGTALPCGDGTIDVVLAGFYLNHVADLGRALREIRRVLAPGGRLSATVWGENDSARHSSLIEEAAGALEPDLAARPMTSSRPPTAELLDALAQSSFVDATVRHLPGTATVRSATDLLDGMRRSTWQTAELIASVPPARREHLHDEVARLLEPHRTADGFAVPAAARLCSAVAA